MPQENQDLDSLFIKAAKDAVTEDQQRKAEKLKTPEGRREKLINDLKSDFKEFKKDLKDFRIQLGGIIRKIFTKSKE